VDFGEAVVASILEVVIIAIKVMVGLIRMVAAGSSQSDDANG